jgi:hypothetical protein
MSGASYVKTLNSKNAIPEEYFPSGPKTWAVSESRVSRNSKGRITGSYGMPAVWRKRYPIICTDISPFIKYGGQKSTAIDLFLIRLV